jgi:hypothetical protein
MRILVLHVLLAILSIAGGLSGQEIFSEGEASMIPGFVRSPLLEEDLKLDEVQTEEYSEFKKKLFKAVSDYGASYAGLPMIPGVANREKKAELIENLVQMVDSTSEFLRPSQQKRLGQIALRYKLLFNESPLIYPELNALVEQDKRLGIKLDETQVVELEDSIEDFRDEYREMLLRHREELKELFAEQEKEALQILDADQRKIFVEKLGPNLNFSTEQLRIPDKN